MAKQDDEPALDALAKRGRGQPTKYSKTFAKQVFKLALLGLTDAEMAGVFDVAERTLNRWKKEHADFWQSLTRGRAVADADVAASLYERALGYSHAEVVITSYQGEITKTNVRKHYPPDTAAASLWLRNRQPARWRATPDPIDGNDVPTPVKVTVSVIDARRTEPDAERPPG
ncbi:MAG: hypothetical protein SHS37scaffold220_39 [Phage 67_12]|nr:MAG: hypothetical protein SHS37scaffold220_39 [Phage 67_12]